MDPWHPFGILRDVCPLGPMLTGLNKTVSLSRVIVGDEWNWPAATRMEVADIIAALPNMDSSRSDMITWRLTPSGEFSVKSALRIFHPAQAPVSWAPIIKGPNMLPSHRFTFWLSLRGRLPVRSLPWIGGNDTHCILCDDGHDETHNHLFFDCTYSQRCMAICHRKVRFYWQGNSWESGVELAARRWRSQHPVHAAYRALLAALVYLIWGARNKLIFEGTRTTPECTAHRALQLTRERIITLQLRDSVASRSLYRLWHIAWH